MNDFEMVLDYESDGYTYDNLSESSSVKAGRSSYICYFCHKNIPASTPSTVHKFYPEFNSCRTHDGCSDIFLESIGKGFEKSSLKVLTDKELINSIKNIINEEVFALHEKIKINSTDDLEPLEDKLLDVMTYDEHVEYGYMEYTTSLMDNLRIEIWPKQIVIRNV